MRKRFLYNNTRVLWLKFAIEAIKCVYLEVTEILTCCFICHPNNRTASNQSRPAIRP